MPLPTAKMLPNPTAIALSLATVLLLTMPAIAQRDRVRMVGGGTETGKITKMTSLGVTIEKSGKTIELTVPEIRSVVFQGEPKGLTQARLNASNGAYGSALTRLAAISRDDVKEGYIKQEFDFVNAYCQAKLALVGEKPIREAGISLNSFVTKNAQSFHFLEATELLGDLLVTMEKYAPAQQKYKLLARAPWPAYRMKSGVLVGQSLLAQEKFAEAHQQFQAALGIKDSSDLGKQQTLAAKLGLGVAAAATGKVDVGIKAVEQVIQDADPEDAKLLAPAYNALGACYLKANQPTNALFAYLHVDLLYGRIGAAHAESLYHLAPLWESLGQDGEARRARQVLAERYPASRWAKKAGL